jgi:hypothetical protein
MLMHIYNTSIWEAEARELQVQGQPGLHSETLFQKKKTITTKTKDVHIH